MQSSAQTSSSGPGRSSGIGSVVVNVNGITSSRSSSKNTTTRGAVNVDTTLWILLAAALGIGYAMGSISTTSTSLLSLSIGSIGRTAWKGITIFEEWVREIVVPTYTMGVLVYLAVRFYGDRRAKSTVSPSKKNASDDSTMLSPFHSSLLSSFRLPPSLRKFSTMTILEEEDESSASLTPRPSSPFPEQQVEVEEEHGDKPIDMNGTFKVVDNNNFGEFLKAQGVPWFLCKAASKARPTHNFKHASSQKLTIQIRGIIESETSYRIGGSFTETTIRGRVFRDTLSYLYDEHGGTESTTIGDENDGENQPPSSSEPPCVGVQTQKIAMGQGYKVQVERRIVRAGTTWVPTPTANPDGHCTYNLDTPCPFDRILMCNKIVYDSENGEEPVIASQMFHRLD